MTIILVTHFMEEAEYLCDRLAIMDAGRVVALDTPAGLVSAAQSEQRITFRLDALQDDAILTALPAVSSVSRANGQIVVTGNENFSSRLSSNWPDADWRRSTCTPSRPRSTTPSWHWPGGSSS